MIIRYLSSAPVGIAVTAALFYVIQVLIQLAPGQAPVAKSRMPASFIRDIHKAAIAAAYRFRYKPRVVDGVAQSTRGLVNRFVFKIED